MATANQDYDVIIVGARCAGAATAMLLARAGLRVLAVDRSAYGSDTLSTHALMRPAVLQLHRWGVLDAIREAGTPAIRRTTFFYEREVSSVEMKARDGIDALYAPRRFVLDAALVDAARDAGADVRHGVAVEGLLRDADGKVCGVRLRDTDGTRHGVSAGLVVGADGANSRVAREVEARVMRAGIHSSGCFYAYYEGIEAEGYEWHYSKRAAAGIVPTNDGQHLVFTTASSRRFDGEIRQDSESGMATLLAENSAGLAARVDRGNRVCTFRGFAGRRGFMRRCVGPGWALVGDAGMFRDPITAHGITDALRDAELLARSVVGAHKLGTASALPEYQTLRDGLSTAFFDGTDLVASYSLDMPSLQKVHVDLNKEMNREAEVLLGFDAARAA